VDIFKDSVKLKNCGHNPITDAGEKLLAEITAFVKENA